MTEQVRRTAAVQRIIDRLRQGPALNTELSSIALRYGARILDARALGHEICCERISGGQTMYALLDRDAL